LGGRGGEGGRGGLGGSGEGGGAGGGDGGAAAAEPSCTVTFDNVTTATLLRPNSCSSASWTSGLAAVMTAASATASEAFFAFTAKVICNVLPSTVASAEAVKLLEDSRRPPAVAVMSVLDEEEEEEEEVLDVEELTINGMPTRVIANLEAGMPPNLCAKAETSFLVCALVQLSGEYPATESVAATCVGVSASSACASAAAAAAEPSMTCSKPVPMMS